MPRTQLGYKSLRADYPRMILITCVTSIDTNIYRRGVEPFGWESGMLWSQERIRCLAGLDGGETSEAVVGRLWIAIVVVFVTIAWCLLTGGDGMEIRLPIDVTCWWRHPADWISVFSVACPLFTTSIPFPFRDIDTWLFHSSITISLTYWPVGPSLFYVGVLLSQNGFFFRSC